MTVLRGVSFVTEQEFDRSSTGLLKNSSTHFIDTLFNKMSPSIYLAEGYCFSGYKIYIVFDFSWSFQKKIYFGNSRDEFLVCSQNFFFVGKSSSICSNFDYLYRERIYVPPFYIAVPPLFY